MSQRVACPCGERFVVDSTEATTQCPSCRRQLRLSRSAPATAAAAAPAASRSAAEGTAALDVRRIACPCGHEIRFRGERGTLECPRCGVRLTVSGESTGRLEQPPIGTDRDTLPDPLGSFATQEHLPSTQLGQRPSGTTRRLSSLPVSNLGSPPRSGLSGHGRTGWIIGGVAAGVVAMIGTVAVVLVMLLGGNRTPVEDGDRIADSSPSSVVPADDDSGVPTSNPAVTPGDASPSSANVDDPGDRVRIGTYPAGPRLPVTTEFVARQLIDEHGSLIESVVRPIPPETNAAPSYLMTLAKLSPDLTTQLGLGGSESAAWRSATDRQAEIARMSSILTERGAGPETASFAITFDPIIAEILAAQRAHSDCSFMILGDWEMLLPHLQALRELTRIMQVRLASWPADRPVSQAVDEYLTLLRLCEEFSRDNLIGRLTALASESAVQAHAMRLFMEDRASDEDRRRIIAGLRRRDAAASLSGFRQAMNGERLVFVLTLRGITPGDRDFGRKLASLLSAIATKPLDENEPQFKILASAANALTTDDRKRALSLWDDFDSLLLDRFADDERDLDKIRDERSRLAKRRMDELQKAIREAGTISREVFPEILVGLLRPADASAFESEIRVMARRRIAWATLAMRVGDLDSTAGPLAIEPSESMGIDPYGGEPLRCVLRSSGPFVYSIGPDRIDDGAESVSSGTSNGDLTIDGGLDR